jgi:hypothetical protein
LDYGVRLLRIDDIPRIMEHWELHLFAETL